MPEIFQCTRFMNARGIERDGSLIHSSVGGGGGGVQAGMIQEAPNLAPCCRG
jgi:hypothetical protein